MLGMRWLIAIAALLGSLDAASADTGPASGWLAMLPALERLHRTASANASPGQQDNSAAALKAGDVLVIEVLEAKNWGGEFPVLDDGAIYGRFGRIVVAGKTVAEAERLLVQNLKRDFKDPHVSILVKSQRQSHVFLVGVQTDGPISYTPGLDLRQVVASVQLPEDADLMQAVVFRDGAAIKKVNLGVLLSASAGEGGFLLKANDVVSVQPIDYVRIWVTGAVQKPGQNRLPEGSDPYQAVAAAGGILLAPENNVIEEQVRFVVRRGPDVIELPARQDPTAPRFRLESGDTIMVQLPALVKVIVGGEVMRSGEFSVPAGTTLPAVVAVAGGITPQGSLANVLVVRKGEARVLDVSQVRAGALPPPFSVEDGDLVYVRQSERLIYVFGSVRQPGRYVMEDGKEYRAAEALARAGGLDDRGTMRRMYLARPGPDGKFQVTQYHLDEFIKSGRLASNPVLQPGDVLLFSQANRFNIGELTQVISSLVLFDTFIRGR
jgi:protein involved in polysaccharide export with SLBB domain